MTRCSLLRPAYEFSETAVPIGPVDDIKMVDARQRAFVVPPLATSHTTGFVSSILPKGLGTLTSQVHRLATALVVR